MSTENLKSKIEAVLFVTAKAMQPIEISEILKVEVEEVEAALLDLMFDYSSRDGALEIDDEDGYIIQVRAEHLDIVEKLCPVELKPSVFKQHLRTFLETVFDKASTDAHIDLSTSAFKSISPVSTPMSVCIIVTPVFFSPLITAH